MAAGQTSNSDALASLKEQMTELHKNLDIIDRQVSENNCSILVEDLPKSKKTTGKSTRSERIIFNDD